MTVDISRVRDYLSASGVSLHPDDKIECTGDLSELKGTITRSVPLLYNVYFTIFGRDNGIFVDYSDGGRHVLRQFPN